MRLLHIGSITGGYKMANLRAIERGDWSGVIPHERNYEWMNNNIANPKFAVIMKGWSTTRLMTRVFHVYVRLKFDDYLLAKVSGLEIIGA